MPIEVDEESLEKNPDLTLAQDKFLLETSETLSNAERDLLERNIMDSIKKDNMAPFFEQVCKDLSNLSSIKMDKTLYDEMKEKNTIKIQEFDAFIEDAEKNLTEMEVREKNLIKSEYLCRIGDFEGALTAFRKTYEKTVSLGQRLDIIFHLIRIGIFNMDHDVISRNIEKAKTLIDEGGDWDRRNRLKVYQGTYAMSIRDFKTSAAQFLDTISTFTSYELMGYVDFVRYTVIVSMIALPRNELYQKIIKGAEIQEVLHSPQQRLLRSYVMSLYDCKYAQFFLDLAEMEKVLKQDRLLNPHYRFYVREMRVKAYSQLLESYSSLTLTYMADSFGVTQDFIDKELHRFIAAGRLHCKIDKVTGVVETNRPDSKNAQYQATIKQGDLLLNRIQKLSRVINI